MRSRSTSVAILATFIASFVICQQSVWAQDQPVFTEYRGVKIGMPVADVHTKLGDPKQKYDSEDDFEFSDSESARVVYDESKKVLTISVMYTGDLASAPAAKAVIGEDLAPRDDGSIYKMAQYPKNGFWVSYVKTSGTSPMVIITMQRMASEP